MAHITSLIRKHPQPKCVVLSAISVRISRDFETAGLGNKVADRAAAGGIARRLFPQREPASQATFDRSSSAVKAKTSPATQSIRIEPLPYSVARGALKFCRCRLFGFDQWQRTPIDSENDMLPTTDTLGLPSSWAQQSRCSGERSIHPAIRRRRAASFGSRFHVWDPVESGRHHPV